MVRLIHVTPELPPTVGGVADYTHILSQRLVEVSDGAVEPVLVRAGWTDDPAPEIEFPVVDLQGQCSAAGLAEAIHITADEAEGSAVVLLEYSGYSYAKRGAPLWLARGLRGVCGKDGLPLVTMFHELYATGPPWSKKFWLSFPQAYVVRRIAQASAAVATNRPDSRDWLQSVSEMPVRLAPVFSNVGEPDSLVSDPGREPYAVVFGKTGKDALYAEHRKRLARCLHVAGLQRLVDIGPLSEHADTGLNGVQIEKKGIVGSEVISRYLRRATLGVLYRNPRALKKSGGLAAYLAHGTPSVIALRAEPESDAMLSEGRHYVSLETAIRNGTGWDSNDWDALGRRGQEWYLQNAHSRKIAQTILQLIQSFR